MYFHHCPDAIEFDKECRRLLKDIYMYDVQRSDRSISSNGLEARTPFLDRSFIQMYLSIPRDIRYHAKHKQCEKYLLRKSVEVCDASLLPSDVLWRMKEAFSDGVSNVNNSWHDIIDSKLKLLEFSFLDNYKDGNLNNTTHMTLSKEQKYYRYLYNNFYPRTTHLIPYYWMPKYI